METWECNLDGQGDGRWVGSRVYVFGCAGFQDALYRVGVFMAVVNAALDGYPQTGQGEEPEAR